MINEHRNMYTGTQNAMYVRTYTDMCTSLEIDIFSFPPGIGYRNSWRGYVITGNDPSSYYLHPTNGIDLELCEALDKNHGGGESGAQFLLKLREMRPCADPDGSSLQLPSG
ncbi:hypothetical protein M413DRAFT_237085 [Hebeloma cylindrosporum]|uniref:Uncharacterized protein n=1 Tax=Hebeloma cylindrosporum TaxID=76867 RepID=A0A0C3C6F4_HEBCY|nr:hypothetical protein M413DRAFT_237085 [Hebeloma cylindrosporum h7]